MPLFEQYPGSAAGNMLAFSDTAERLSRSVPESIRLGIALRDQRLQEEKAAELVRRQRQAELAAAVSSLGSTSGAGGGRVAGAPQGTGAVSGGMGVGGLQGPEGPSLEDMDRFNRMVHDLDRIMQEKGSAEGQEAMWAGREARPEAVAPVGPEADILSYDVEPSADPRSPTITKPMGAAIVPRPALPPQEPGPVSPLWQLGLSGRASPSEASLLLTNPTMRRLAGDLPPAELAQMLASHGGYSDILAGQKGDEDARLQAEYAQRQRNAAMQEAVDALRLDPNLRGKSPEDVQRIAAAQLDMPETVQGGLKRGQERVVEGIKVGPKYKELAQEDQAREAYARYREQNLLDEADTAFQANMDRIGQALQAEVDPVRQRALADEMKEAIASHERAVAEAPKRAAAESKDVGTRTQMGPASIARTGLAASRAEQIQRRIQSAQTPDERAEVAGDVYDSLPDAVPGGRAAFVRQARTDEGWRTVARAASALATPRAEGSGLMGFLLPPGTTVARAPPPAPAGPEPYVQALRTAGWTWNGQTALWEKAGQPSATDEEARTGYARQSGGR